MKQILLIISFISFFTLFGQEKIYHPEADAQKDLDSIMLLAKDTPKNIIVQVGGNWCKWCLLLNDYIHENETVKKLKDQYYYYHLNYSKENKNEEILTKYGTPQKLGFPVLLVLNPKGELLHTQETGSLEEGKGYDQEKVVAFFEKWLYINPVESIVQKQLDAYNKGDLDTFLSYYSETIEISRYNSTEKTIGKENMRPMYENLFKNYPNLVCELKNRIILDNKVIDHESITLTKEKTESRVVVAVYEIQDGLIQKVMFIEPTSGDDQKN